MDLAAVARTAGAPMELVALDAGGRVTAFELGLAGGFAVSWTSDVGAAAGFAWADVDEDGDMDVAVAAGDAGLSVRLAEDGQLQAPMSEDGIGRVTDVAWARLSDGRFGLAVATDDRGRVYAVDGSGLLELGATTELGAERVVWQDRDEDGQPEAIFGGTLETLEPTGDAVTSVVRGVDPLAELGPLLAVADRYVLTSGTSMEDGDIARLLRPTESSEGEPIWEVADEVSREARGVDLLVAELDRGVLSAVGVGIVTNGADPWLVCSALLTGLDPPAPRTWPLPEGQGYPQRVALGDVDLDGRPEVAIFATGTLVVVRNEDGDFGADELLRIPGLQDVGQIVFQDLDGDGYPELLVGFKGSSWPPPGAPADPALMVFRNDAGSFSETPLWTSDAGAALISGSVDVDGDGLVDLVVGISDGEASVRRGCADCKRWYFHDEPAWRSQPDLQPTALAWGDLDGDRDLDLAIHTKQNGLHIFENRSTPTTGIELVAATVLPSNEDGTGLFWIDWNGDGAPDLLEATNQTMQLHRNVNGTLEPAWLNPESMTVGRVHPLDWDLDGDLDLVVDTGSGNVSVYLQEPRGPTFAPTRRALNVDQASRALTTGDVDGDGRRDLFMATSSGDALAMRPPRQLDLGLPIRSPRVSAWIEGGEGAAGPIDPRPVQIALRVSDPDGDPIAALELEYSVDGGGLWRPAVEVSGDLVDVAAPTEGASARITWDWTTEGLPLEHRLPTDHPIDHERLALRVRAVLGPPRTVAGPLVMAPTVITTTGELRRWPDDDNDGVPNRWDPCHEDPRDDSDGDGSCDRDDLCAGDDRTLDVDGDGVCGDRDCDDADAGRRPDARELCLDGIDNDCDDAADMDDTDCGPEALAGTGLWCGQVGPGGSGPVAWLVTLLLTLGIRRRRSVNGRRPTSSRERSRRCRSASRRRACSSRCPPSEPIRRPR